MPAAGSDLRVALIPEVTFGVTPATPAFQTLRTTNSGLRTNKGVVRSEERQFHRNVIDELQVSQDVDGSYDFEMSHASVDTVLEAVLGGIWAANVLRNGLTERSFTFEEFLELGTMDSFRRFDGCVIDTLSLNIQNREKITGSFGIMGRREQLATTAIAGATYVAPNSEVIMTGSASVMTLTVGALGALQVSKMTLEIKRNARRVNIVGSNHSALFNYGMFEVTGAVEVYFEGNAAYQAVLNHETAAISVTIGQDANKRYTFSIPRARLGNGSPVAGSADSDIMYSIPFTATLVSTPVDHSIQITRAVA